MKQDKISVSEAFAIVKKALATSIRVKGIASILVNIVGWAVAFLPVISARYLENLTDLLYYHFSGDTLSDGMSSILSCFALLMLLYASQEVYNSLSKYILQKDTIQTKKFISKTIMECKCYADFRFIENDSGFRQKLSFAEQYSGEYTARSMQELILMVQRVLTIVSISAKLFQVNFFIVIILWITCIPAAVLSYLQSDETYRQRTKWMVEGDSVIMQFIACVRPEAMKDIRHFKAYPYLQKEWRKSADCYIEKKEALTKKHVTYNVIADLFHNVVYLVILVIVGKNIYEQPELGVGLFMLVLTLSSKLQQVISQFLISILIFGQNISYMKDFFELKEMAEQNQLQKVNAISEAEIQFKNVSFSYPGATRKVIDDLSVTIGNGEKIAIVGENGSGKSTFISLLMGFYTPQEGKICVNGVEHNDMSIAALRKGTAAVFQDFCHYEGTIRENVVASDKSYEMSLKNMQELLSKANLDEIVKEQESGLDEEVGIFSKTGNNLSGGQWQRLALARALYRRNTQLMILDEPTAALDPLAEAELYRNFAEITSGKTTLLISHRLGITSMVDRILVFHEGRIVEDGDHTTLMKKNGVYAEMYRAQAQWYQ